MRTLTVTAKGQVTLHEDLLRHLGVEPGQRIEIRELPAGRIEVRAAQPPGTIEHFIGVLADKRTTRLSLDEMNEAAARGWTDET
jgi:bifunctional DNA-binding transcriptional regulator/antitoxin component of YhaV-PrlF toxin-antitoxin module